MVPSSLALERPDPNQFRMYDMLFSTVLYSALNLRYLLRPATSAQTSRCLWASSREPM